MGITVISVKRLLPEHFFLGLLLIPPLALKTASTGYRFVRYYSGDPRYNDPSWSVAWSPAWPLPSPA